MIHNYKDSYDHIELHPLTEEFIEDMRRLRNKNRNCFIFSDIITEDGQVAWYNSYIRKNGDYLFSIIRKDDNRFIGTVSLYNVMGDEAEFGRLMINKDIVKEKGLGLEVVICACKIGFKQLKLERMILEVFEDNLPALKTYIKAGFNIYHKYDFNNKVIIQMNITKDEFEKRN